jgi:hypothetical protein
VCVLVCILYSLTNGHSNPGERSEIRHFRTGQYGVYVPKTRDGIRSKIRAIEHLAYVPFTDYGL